jgi:hypothetical protein
MELTPKDFCQHYPYSSVYKNAESEQIALNVMRILWRTKNEFRPLSWEEYVNERKKDGATDDEIAGHRSDVGVRGEKYYFDQVMGYCTTSEAAKTFCPAWSEVGN